MLAELEQISLQHAHLTGYHDLRTEKKLLPKFLEYKPIVYYLKRNSAHGLLG